MTRHGLHSRALGTLVALLAASLSVVWSAESATAVPPAAPALVAPADGASVTVPFTISWAEVSGAGGYHWQLSRSSTFDTVVEHNDRLLPGAATTDAVISGLPDGTWFWRVQAVSRELEVGAWSGPRRVVVTGAGPGVPARPTLQPPHDATQFHPWETITFSWNAVPGAVSYVLQESTDPEFPVGTRVRQVNLPGTTERISLSPNHQGSYEARVLAVNADGLLSIPSNRVSFSVSDTNPLPAPPTLVSPASGSTRALPVTLSWTHVPNHQDDGYQVQVSGSSSFSTVERTFRTGDDQLLVPTLTAGTKFWRVRSQHGYTGSTEAYTAWSSTGSFTVPAGPVAVGAVTFPSPKFSGGEARGSIDLTAPAPSGGATVTLSASHPALLPELPDSRVVPAGSTSVNVLVAPTGFANSLRGMRVGFVTTPTPVTVTASYAGTSASTTITLLPPRLNDTPLQLFPVKATGGADMLGIVDLESGCFAGFCDGLAPPGGFDVSLSSSSPAASVPATFTLASGAGGDSFPISTTPVGKETHVTISARADGVAAHWTLTLTPSPEPDRLQLVPSTTSGGSQGQVFIPLSELAGHDQLVEVTSSNPAVAQVPQHATVNASTELGRFDITTSPVNQPTAVTISVTGRGVTRSAVLTVSPPLPALTGLSVSPTSVAAGGSATGTVTLGSPAPSDGVAVSLGSNQPGSASVPGTVTVPAGATSATFPVTTSATSGATTVQLAATLGNSTQFASLSITTSSSATLSSVTLSPTTVTGGSSSTGTVRLTAAAPSGGTVVALTDDSSAVTVPSSVTVSAGSTSRTFTATTTAVSAQTTATISGTAGGVTRSASLTVNPPTPAAPSLQSPANGATGVAQPITLDWSTVTNAVTYEVQVDDSSTISSPYVANPTVTASEVTLSGLPARQLWWRVRARNGAGVAGPFSSVRSFTPTADAATSTLSALTVSPTAVTGGTSATGTVSLTAPAPTGGTAVTLTSSDASAAVPTSVTVAGGASSASFPVSTTSVVSARSVTLTATAAGVSRSAILTVNPPTTSPLPAPQLESPAVDQRFEQGQTIAFNWTDVPGAGSYTIVIDDQDTFSSPVQQVTVPTSNYSTSTLPATRMWWRVRAVDGGGNAGTWSGSRRFEIR